ncbi:MAG: ankyrin repeat domain-containing protein [Epsilonproteobacteria bacterium]|nr:ankyrin repeat domain-containing protein [Campylobacterota bacterium]
MKKSIFWVLFFLVTIFSNVICAEEDKGRLPTKQSYVKKGVEMNHIFAFQIAKFLEGCKTSGEVIQAFKAVNCNNKEVFRKCLEFHIECGTPMHDKDGNIIFWIPQFGLAQDCGKHSFCKKNCPVRSELIDEFVQNISIQQLKKIVPSEQKNVNKYLCENVFRRALDGSTLLELLINMCRVIDLRRLELERSYGLSSEQRGMEVAKLQERLVGVRSCIDDIMIFLAPQKNQIERLARECSQQNPNVEKIQGLLNEQRYFEYFIGSNGLNLPAEMQLYDSLSDIDSLCYEDGKTVFDSVETPLSYVVCLEKRSDLLDVFLRHGSCINAMNGTHNHILHKFMSSGKLDTSLIRCFLQSGASFNGINFCGKSLLHFAASHANEEIMELLLERGYDIHGKDDQGDSPLHCLLKSDSQNRTKIAHKIIQQYKPDLTLRDGNNVTIQDLLGASVLQELFLQGDNSENSAKTKKRKRLEFEDTDSRSDQ